MRSRWTSMAVASAVLLAGCGDGRASGPSVAVRDSAGITIVENPSPDDSLAHAWWRLGGPEVDIGGVEAVEPYALYQVRDALRRSDGSIVVANAGSADIRVFDSGGEHVSTAGREGDGPGEYRSPVDLERGDADSLLVLDERARRVAVLGPDGDFARSVGVSDVRTVRRIVGRAPSGGVLTAPTTLVADATATNPDEIARPDGPLVDVSLDGARADTLGLFPGTELVVRIDQPSGSGVRNVFFMLPPFGKVARFAVSGDLVYVGIQDAPEIRVYASGRTLTRVVRTGRAPEPLTDAHVDALEERRIRALPAERRAAARSAGGYRALPRGDIVPPYGDLLVDRAGNLWVSDYDDPTDPPGRWTVYDAGGAVLARIMLPARFTPYDVGDDWILGRELDELDVEHVRLYRIVRP